MQLLSLLDLSLIGRSTEDAVEYELEGGRALRVTFGDLEQRSNRLAGVLTAEGIGRGDRLAFFLSNRVEFIDLFLACLKLGVIAVPINILYRERETGHILRDAEPKFVVTTRDLRSCLNAETGCPLRDIEELTAAAEAADSRRVGTLIDGDDAAAIVYTSGTTGLSKGAVLSHNNFAANTVNLVACWRITSEDRYLGVLPLFHVHGLANGVLCSLVSGSLMRLAERFEIARAAELFETFKPSLFFGVPTIYVRLLELPEETAIRIGARTRLFVSGSAPLPAHILEAFRKKYGHTILERYGMSETLMNMSNPYEGERRAGSVGFPLPGVSAKLLDADLHPVSEGEVGEIFIRGANVSRGYWRRPPGEAFIDGWFRTGDLAERSGDGYYTLRGRGSELIIAGGFNIYPREIEDLLLEQPGVREAAVCGMPDERRGELPIAYIVADDPFDARMLEDVCRQNLASFKVPRVFVRLAALPRNALGKVQKNLLPIPPAS